MLSIMQKREASRLQHSGMLLREIARRIDCSFEAVALCLYGGIDDWEPRLGSAADAETTPQDEGKTDAQRDGAGALYAGDDDGGAERAGRGVPHDRDDGEERAAAQGLEPDAQPAHAAARVGAAAARQEARPPVDPPRPAPPPPVPHPPASPAAQTPGPGVGGDVRLTNGAGDYLDRSGVGMTRHIGKAWRGTLEQAATIKRKKPHYRALEEEPVE